VRRVKEAPLVGEKNESDGRGAAGRPRCEIAHPRHGAPAPCARPGEETVDGLLLCEEHALETRLEGQIDCWDGVLFHVDLWSREASRQNRTQVVGLLNAERAKATSAVDRARSDLDRLRKRTSRGSGPPTTRGHPLSPPRGAPRPARARRRLRRRWCAA
jgi:hypothetical protein